MGRFIEYIKNLKNIRVECARVVTLKSGQLDNPLFQRITNRPIFLDQGQLNLNHAVMLDVKLTSGPGIKLKATQ